MEEADTQGPTKVDRVTLPGMGVRYEFETAAGERVAVVHHRTGERDLIVYDPDDPDTARRVMKLDSDESRTLSELLGGAAVAGHLASLQRIEGLAIDWLPVVDQTPYAGKTIGDTQARTRTGSSVVAVIRGDQAIPAPGPEMILESGDTLVVVGTVRGIEELAVILRTG